MEKDTEEKKIIPMEKLIDDRFAIWKQQLGNNTAAPFLLIGLKNDSIDGTLSCYFTHEVKLYQVETVLKNVLKQMKSFNKERQMKMTVKRPNKK